jgi:hypothetical protein
VLPNPLAEVLLEVELLELAAAALVLAVFAIPLLAAGCSVFNMVGIV